MVQTELHRHLDVSIRTSTMLELCQKLGLESQSTSLDRFSEKLIMRKPFSDLNEVLAQFILFSKVLDRPETLERVAFEAVEDCRAEGTRKIEFRYSPSFVCEGKPNLSWEDSLGAFERGIQRAMARYPEMKAGLICIASREQGFDAVGKTIEFFLKHHGRFIGIDLAGNEDQAPCRDYESLFKPVRTAKAKITIHAGEAVGPENMWEAIEYLGAQRIGHGIACVKDPELVKHLAKERICLEMCPTSNWLIGAFKDLSQHVLPQVLRAGVPVSINTDDPGIFGVSMPHEIEVCRKKMGMSEAEIQACMAHADRASFLN